MIPAELTTVVTVAGAIVAALVGLAGLVVGLVGLRHARLAKEAAASANLIAKDAVSVARAAKDVSAASNVLAANANDLAARANQISRQATDVVSAADLRAIEQHDVRWTGAWESPGMYIVKNIGIHVAQQVVVQIRFAGSIEVAEVEKVGPNEVVRLELPRAKEVYDTAVANSGVRTRGAVTSVRRGPGTYPVHERIFWRTPLNAPQEHSEDRNIRLKPKQG